MMAKLEMHYRNMLNIILHDIIQTLMCLDNYNSIFGPPACVNAGCPWSVWMPATEDVTLNQSQPIYVLQAPFM
jgi:hypothetical protein